VVVAVEEVVEVEEAEDELYGWMAGTQWQGDTLDLDQSGGHCQACGYTQRTLEGQRVGGGFLNSNMMLIVLPIATVGSIEVGYFRQLNLLSKTITTSKLFCIFFVC